MTIVDKFTIAKDIFNIIFFIVIGIIGILTYFQAKKSFFAPIRTEVFKLQIKTFEDILSYFQNKNEHDFLVQFEIEKIFNLNAHKMIDEYASLFFNVDLKTDRALSYRKELYKNIVGAVVSKEYAEANFLEMDSTDIPKNDTTKIDSPAIILSEWQKYEHGMIDYTNNYKNSLDELNKLISSPLIPQELRDLLVKFSNDIHSNLSLVGTVLTKKAKDLPNICKTHNDLSKLNMSWFWNEFNTERDNEFADSAKEILEFINNYLEINNLKTV